MAYKPEDIEKLRKAKTIDEDGLIPTVVDQVVNVGTTNPLSAAKNLADFSLVKANDFLFGTGDVLGNTFGDGRVQNPYIDAAQTQEAKQNPNLIDIENQIQQELKSQVEAPVSQEPAPSQTPPVAAPTPMEQPQQLPTPELSKETALGKATDKVVSGGDELSKALKLQEEALNEETQVKNKIAELKLKAMDEEKNLGEKVDKTLKEARLQYQKDLAEGQAKITALEEKYNNTEIDPNRILSSQSGSQKLMTAVAVALGGIANALVGNRDISANPALKAIDNAIETDLKRQQLELERMKNGVGMARNSLADKMTIFGNLETALKAERLDLRLKTEKEMERQALVLAPDLNAVAQKKVLGQFKIDTLKLKNDIAKDQAAIAKDKAQAILYNAEAGEKQRVAKNVQAMKAIDPYYDLGDNAKTQNDRFITGLPKQLFGRETGFIQSAKDRDKVNQVILDYKSIQDSGKEIEKILNMPANDVAKYITGDKGRLEVLRGAIKSGIRVRLTGGGNVSEWEQKMLNDQVPDIAWDKLDMNERAKLKEIIRQSDTYFKNAMSGYGLKPVQLDFKKNK